MTIANHNGRLDERQRYERDGFIVTQPILTQLELRQARQAMEDVMAGRYETGLAPRDAFRKPDDDPRLSLCKIDQPQVANRTIHRIISKPEIGEYIAALTGAELVQAWAVQLLYKPAGSEAASVGWHQDMAYWQDHWTPDSEVLTAWLAISDVAEESGPLCFVRGSHRWGLRPGGSFFEKPDSQSRQSIPLPDGATWEEVTAPMPAGAFSVHHKYTVHGSYPNRSNGPRMSFAIHLRTNRATPIHGRARVYDYVGKLSDESVCPILYRAGQTAEGVLR
ncbi:MAG TPA: phytanoyl-CoA dioxygenase family protein [Candidatus Sumerlaeota bacterium]|nr:phytanoyl-CoA dioxygenase family protein [Candidatus Sumerlaeota bacterium]